MSIKYENIFRQTRSKLVVNMVHQNEGVNEVEKTLKTGDPNQNRDKKKS